MYEQSLYFLITSLHILLSIALKSEICVTKLVVYNLKKNFKLKCILQQFEYLFL